MAEDEGRAKSGKYSSGTSAIARADHQIHSHHGILRKDGDLSHERRRRGEL